MVVLSDYSLLILFQGTLISDMDVACPQGMITFTCTLPGSGSTVFSWEVMPPAVSSLSTASILLQPNQLNIERTFGEQGFMFQAILTDINETMATSTLTAVTEVLLLEGSMVSCVRFSERSGPVAIVVAGE